MVSMERGQNFLQIDGENSEIHRTVAEIFPVEFLVARIVFGGNVQVSKVYRGRIGAF